jgi:hypothetical protein
MTEPKAKQTELLDHVREIARHAHALAISDSLELRNRAIEIAAMAECMIWAMAPDEAEWLVDIE